MNPVFMANLDIRRYIIYIIFVFSDPLKELNKKKEMDTQILGTTMEKNHQ